MWLLLVALLAQSADFSAEGTKALDAKDYAAAVDFFTKAAASDPKDYGAQFNLALSYSMLGKDAEAIPHYKIVLDLKPGLYEAELNLGLSMLRTKDATGAIAHLQGAANQKPGEFRPVFYYAQALLDAGRTAEAESAFAKALSLNPASAQAESGLAHALSREGRLSDAEPHFGKAASLDASYRDGLLELGSLYEANRQTAEAIAIYREFPENPGAQERLGNLLAESGRFADAIAPLETAVSRSPTLGNKLALAQAYEQNKQLDKATPLAAQLVAAQPGDYRIGMFYGRLLRDQRQFAPAANQFLAATKLKSDSAEAWSELAAMLISLEQYPQALTALDHVRALGAEKPGHFFFRATTLDHLHQRQEAIENYNKFLETDQGKSPNQDFQARQRIRILQDELKR